MILLLPLLTTLSAEASVPDLYGMGATNVGRAGTGTAVADDAWAAFYNPAGVARLRHITLELGFLGGQADLVPFDGIVYDRDGDGSTTDESGFAEVGSIGTDYRARSGEDRPLYTSGLQIGVGYPLGWRFGIGLAAYLPSEGLLRLQTQDPTLPYYVMYRNRNNRFSLHPALGFQVVDGVAIGLGAQVAATASLNINAVAAANITAFPASGDAAQEIDADVNLAIRGFEASTPASVQPVAGLLVSLGAFVPESRPRLKADLDRMKLGLTYRGRWGVETSATVEAGVHGTVTFDDDTILIDDLLEEPLKLTIEDLVAFYNPPEIALGFSGGHGPFQASFDAVWTRWSRFKELTAPPIDIAVDAIAGANIRVALGEPLPEANFKNTWTLRGGLDTTLPIAKCVRGVGTVSLRARGGYAFVPTPVPDQTGVTNYVDNDKHVGALGIGVELGHLARVSKGPIRFDLALQTQSLVRRTTVKDPSLVADTDGDGRLNWPAGYPFDGSYESGGRTWVMQGTLELRFGDPRFPSSTRSATRKARAPEERPKKTDKTDATPEGGE